MYAHTVVFDERCLVIQPSGVVVAGSTSCGTTPHKPQFGALEENGHSLDQDAVYDIWESSVSNGVFLSSSLFPNLESLCAKIC